MPGQWSETKRWPEGSRECRNCKELKPLTEFHKHKQGFSGYYHICKPCRVPIGKAQWADVDIRTKILNRIKTRSTKKDREFNLTIDDIIIPEICPVFRVPIKIPSVDRIDSTKGYTKDNIRIIENRANVLKNNATIQELELILADLKGLKNV